MKARARLLASGLISADITFRVSEMPRRAEKYRADDVCFRLGGGGAIAAVAMQRLGADVELAGRLGDDVFGDLLRQEIADRLLGHSLIIRTPDSKSPISSIFLDDSGDRQIVNYRGSGAAPAVSGADELDLKYLRSMETPQAVLVDTRWETAAIQVLSYAREAGIPAVMDAETPVSHESMKLASHIGFSRQGLRDYAGVDDVERGLRQASDEYGCWVCVTDGEAGVHFLHQGDLAHIPAFRIMAVDTLGAGDVWHAAFTLQLAQGKAEAAAIVFANAAAALKCASLDSLDGIPSFDQVMAFLQARQG